MRKKTYKVGDDICIRLGSSDQDIINWLNSSKQIQIATKLKTLMRAQIAKDIINNPELYEEIYEDNNIQDDKKHSKANKVNKSKEKSNESIGLNLNKKEIVPENIQRNTLINTPIQRDTPIDTTREEISVNAAKEMPEKTLNKTENVLINVPKEISENNPASFNGKSSNVDNKLNDLSRIQGNKRLNKVTKTKDDDDELNDNDYKSNDLCTQIR